VVGKYISLRDAYKSIYEALDHAGISNDVKINTLMVEAEELDAADDLELISGADGILVPGGFGDRGIPGKLKAIKYARENNIPFLGICLGMQCAVIEFARHVLGYEDANSTEFDEDSTHPVIDLMFSQRNITDKGGTMRLGAYPCKLIPGTNAAKAYNSSEISERHRHRYEFNNAYREAVEAEGLKIVGTSPDGTLVEMVELTTHPWFVACQFHPEFKSRPLEPHPLFNDFIKAAKGSSE
ncbi:MAG: CTP synthase, partial [Victivallaceae bacterium]|nr:CTP synthase [Victivallaceae bacterium]